MSPRYHPGSCKDLTVLNADTQMHVTCASVTDYGNRIILSSMRLQWEFQLFI